MHRTARITSQGGRADARPRIFERDQDDESFKRVTEETIERISFSVAADKRFLKKARFLHRDRALLC